MDPRGWHSNTVIYCGTLFVKQLLWSSVTITKEWKMICACHRAHCYLLLCIGFHNFHSLISKEKVTRQRDVLINQSCNKGRKQPHVWGKWSWCVTYRLLFVSGKFWATSFVKLLWASKWGKVVVPLIDQVDYNTQFDILKCTIKIQLSAHAIFMGYAALKINY